MVGVVVLAGSFITSMELFPLPFTIRFFPGERVNHFLELFPVDHR